VVAIDAGTYRPAVPALMNHKLVIAAGADQGVGSPEAYEIVIAAAAGADEPAAVHKKTFHIGRNREVDRGNHYIDVRPGTFLHSVAAVVDDIHIVAAEADQGIGSAQTDEMVVASAAGTGEPAAVHKKTFHIGRNREVDRGNTSIDVRPGSFLHSVAAVVDEIHIVAAEADQGIGSAQTDEMVVASAACPCAPVFLPKKTFHIGRNREVDRGN